MSSGINELLPMKTRESIEAAASQSQTTASAPKKYRRGENPKSLANLQMWKPGQSGNPGGRKNDMAQEIARAVFEKNPELIYAAFAKALAKGGAFAYQVLADRAYGKLKETREVGLEFNEIPDDQIQNEIERILGRLGLAREVDDAAEAGIAAARAEKTNGEAKNPNVLPGHRPVKA